MHQLSPGGKRLKCQQLSTSDSDAKGYLGRLNNIQRIYETVLYVMSRDENLL